MPEMPNSFYKMRLQGIMVVERIILDWIFVLMNTTTKIPCRRALKRELAIYRHVFLGLFIYYVNWLFVAEMEYRIFLIKRRRQLFQTKGLGFKHVVGPEYVWALQFIRAWRFYSGINLECQVTIIKPKVYNTSNINNWQPGDLFVNPSERPDLYSGLDV